MFITENAHYWKCSLLEMFIIENVYYWKCLLLKMLIIQLYYKFHEYIIAQNMAAACFPISFALSIVLI
jgi:hypothetical protein